MVASLSGSLNAVRVILQNEEVNVNHRNNVSLESTKYACTNCHCSFRSLFQF